MPQNVSPQQYADLKAKYQAAKTTREMLEYRRSEAAKQAPFSPALHDAHIAELEALIAAEQGGGAYNRSASDLEEIRSFLEAELTAARELLARPAPLEPAPLADPSAKALAAHIAAIEQYRNDYAAYGAAVGPVHDHLTLAYHLAGEAQQIVFRARRAAKLFDPSHVVPAPRGGSLHTTPPNTIEEIDHDLEAIAAQRVDSSPNGVVSSAELKLRELRRVREEHELNAAAEAEAAKLDAMPIAERRVAIEQLRVATAAG